MATGKPNTVEQFMLLFGALKEAAGGDPRKLAVYYDQKPSLKIAADSLAEFVGRGDFERRVFHGRRKYMPQSPDGFERAWREFKDCWENTLLYGSLMDLVGDVELEPLEPEGAERSLQTQATDLDSPDPDFDDEFDPLCHDGSKALEMAFWVTNSYADEVGSDSEESIHVASKIGLEAYEYLTETIGLAPSDVFRRWRDLPVVFMPPHVSNRHGLTERGSLHDLLDNAVRAYVFGAPAASIAMCRAALEMVLKSQYGLEHQYRDPRGRLRDKSLGELIVLADEKYKVFQGGRIRKLTDDANRIMHRYSERKPLSSEDEAIIREFFKTLKFLIERAP